jgi:hypothetical protein
MLYRLHCLRTQDHQKHILPLQSRIETPLRGSEILAKFWGLESTTTNPKLFSAAVSTNPGINMIAVEERERSRRESGRGERAVEKKERSRRESGRRKRAANEREQSRREKAVEERESSQGNRERAVEE